MTPEEAAEELFMLEDEAADQIHMDTEAAIADARPMSTFDLKCCLIDAAKSQLVIAGLSPPALAYPSACGDAPPCLDRSYMTSHLIDPGVELFQAGVINEDTSGCAFRRMATVRITVGLCQQVSLDAAGCGGDLMGNCEHPAPGTYAYEAKQQDDFLDVLSSLGQAFKRCLCIGSKSCSPLEESMLLRNCSTPELVGTSTDCSNRTAISADYRLAFG